MNQQECSIGVVKRKEMLHFHDVCDAWLRTIFTPWGLDLKLHSSNAWRVWSLLNAVMKWEKSPGTPFQSPQSLVWHGNKRKLYYAESRSSSGHIKKTTKGNCGASPKAKSLPHTHFFIPPTKRTSGCAALFCWQSNISPPPPPPSGFSNITRFCCFQKGFAAHSVLHSASERLDRSFVFRHFRPFWVEPSSQKWKIIVVQKVLWTIESCFLFPPSVKAPALILLPGCLHCTSRSQSWGRGPGYGSWARGSHTLTHTNMGSHT